MNLRETIKRILNEELGDTKSNYEKQVRLLEKLLYSKSYEGVCGFRFIEDEDDDRVRSIMIKFSEVWYMSNDDSLYLNKKLRLIQETKKKVADIIGRYLNIDNIYVGSYLQECNSSLNEQQDTKSNYEKQVAVLKRLLNSKSYDGLCGYSFTADSDKDEVGSVILRFTSKWYRLSDDQLRALSQAEDDIRDISKKFLGMENLNIRYYSEDCDSSLNEQKNPKSFLQKSPKYGEKKKHRPDIQGEIEELQRVTQYLNRDEGLDITVNDLVNAFQKSKEITLDNETWSQLENTESNEIEKGDFDAVIDIAKKYNKSNPKKLAEKLKSGDYNRPLIVKFGDRYHVVAGNTRLSTSAALGLNPKVFIATIDPSDNLQESIDSSNPKDDAFQRVLKKVIPDGSTYKYSYSLPYSDDGEVKVIMKYSPLPSSKLMKMVREDGTFYNGIQLNLQIDELIWKSDFDKEWETIKRPHDLSTRFWSEFEDEMSDRFRKAVGMGYVDVYYRNPDTITQ